MICHIAALSKNRVIGDKGDLPWRLPEDLKYFKATTLGHCLIMGRKTFESLGRPLPKRTNVVVTRNSDWVAEGCHAFTSVNKALEFCKQQTPDQKIFIAGGGEIFKQTLDLADQREKPLWVEVDSKKLEGVFKRVPDRSDLSAEINEQLIVELYSK